MGDLKPKLEEVEEKPLNKDEGAKKKKSFAKKLEYVRDNITVEPLLAGLIIPSVINMYAMVNLNLDKACRVNLGYSDEICDELIKRTGNHTEIEKEVQKLIVSIDIWRGILRTLIPCIIIMFLGSWSDRTGRRKLVILLPVCGEILTTMNNLICVYFFYEIPVQYTVFMETIFGAISGGWVTMFLGVFAYISDITSEETRTFRVGLVNFCMTVGIPVGIASSGILLQKLGYFGIFSMTGSLFICVLLYGCFCLKEPERLLKEKGFPPIERPAITNKSFFDVSHVLETINVAFRKRIGMKRVKILLTLFVTFILFGPTMSEHHILYLFVRHRLNWDMVKHGLFTSYAIILHAFGAMFSITILSKKMQVDDSLLCLISIASKFVGGIWTAFVRTDLEMYLVPVVELLNATTFTSLRSIISKLVDKQENAKVNSLFSLTETVASLLFHPFYSWLYMSTLNVFAGTVFLVSAGLIVPASVILVIFYVQHRKELGLARKKALEAEEKKETETKSNNVLNPYYVSEKDKLGMNEKLDKPHMNPNSETYNKLDIIKDNLELNNKLDNVIENVKRIDAGDIEKVKSNGNAVIDKNEQKEVKNEKLSPTTKKTI